MTTLLIEVNMFKYRLKQEIKEEMNDSVEGQGVEDSNLVTDHLVHNSYLYFSTK